MIATISFVSLMYIEGYTSPIEDEIIRLGILSEETFPLFSSATFLGGIIGSSFAGPISEWLGIKTSLLITSCLGTIGGMTLVLAYGSVSMILAKGLIGIYIGISTSCIPLYVAEISPADSRNFYGAMLGVSLRTGVVLSYFVGIWLGFRWLAVIYLSIIAFMNLNFAFLPESPRWLINKGFYKKAAQVNEYLYGSYKEICQVTYTPISKVLEEEKPLTLRQKMSTYFTWPVFRPILVCSSLHIFRTSSGYELLLSYSAHTLETGVNINPKFVALLLSVFQLLGSIVSVLALKKINWKRLLMITTIIQILCNGLLGLTFYLSVTVYKCGGDQDNIILCSVLQYAPLVLTSAFGFSFALGIGSISWWLYGQILHHRYTRLSAGIITFVSYSSCYLNQLIAPILVAYFGADIVFVGLAAMACFSLCVQCSY